MDVQSEGEDVIVSLQRAFDAHAGLRVREGEVRKALAKIGAQQLSIAPENEAGRYVFCASKAMVSRISNALSRIALRPLTGRYVNLVLSIENQERLRWTKQGWLPSLRSETIRKGQIISIPTYDPMVIQSISAQTIALWRTKNAP